MCDHFYEEWMEYTKEIISSTNQIKHYYRRRCRRCGNYEYKEELSNA